MLSWSGIEVISLLVPSVVPSSVVESLECAVEVGSNVYHMMLQWERWLRVLGCDSIFTFACFVLELLGQYIRFNLCG